MKVLIGMFVVLIWSNSVSAQERFLGGDETDIIKVTSHSTAIAFEDERAFSKSEDPTEPNLKFLFGLRFYNPKDNLIPGAGTDDSLPDCDKANVRQDEIVNDSADLDLIDLLFYNYEDKDQMARARNWDRPTAPYLPGDLYNPHSLKDPQQLFARWVNLICLPTRVRRVYNGEGVALLEYREGAKAWTND